MYRFLGRRPVRDHDVDLSHLRCQQVGLHQVVIDTPGQRPFYGKRGKLRSGKGHYYQCKACGRRNLVSDPGRLHDNNRCAIDVLGRIANKAPVRASYRGAKLKSLQAYYQILDFLVRRCVSYIGAVDPALIDGRLTLPADLNVQRVEARIPARRSFSVAAGN